MCATQEGVSWLAAPQGSPRRTARDINHGGGSIVLYAATTATTATITPACASSTERDGRVEYACG